MDMFLELKGAKAGGNFMLIEYDYSLLEPISIIGDFTTSETVNIELWKDGVAQNISPSGCDEIDETGKFAWSTANILVLSSSKVQYHWRMSTSGMATIQEGDFVLRSIEGDDGMMPSLNDQSSYIKVI